MANSKDRAPLIPFPAYNQKKHSYSMGRERVSEV